MQLKTFCQGLVFICLLISSVNLIIAAPDEYENDTNHTLANWIPVNGTAQMHTFDPAGDNDWVKFNATEGARYIIQTGDLRNNTNTRLTLYDTDGTIAIVDNDDIESGVIRRSKVIWNATGTGTYFVMSEDGNDSHSGGIYDISVTEFPNLTLHITGDSNRTLQRGELFNITLNVSCDGINCNNIEIYLDPEKQKSNTKKGSSPKEGNLLNKIESLTEEKYDVIVVLKDIPEAEIKGKNLFGSKSSNLKANNVFSFLKNREKRVDKRQNIVLSDLKVSSALLSAKGNLRKFTLGRKYNIINSFSGKITREGLEVLKSNSFVESVYLDSEVRAVLDDSVPQIKANDSWNVQLNGINITGKGQTICVIDTGINYNHSDFGGANGFPSSKVIGGYDFVNDDEDPWDDNGHGSHCAGIAASEDGIYKGVAPDANIVAVKSLNSGGNGTESDVIAGIDWCVYHAEELNITVISMSLGEEATKYQTYCDNIPLAKAVNYANNLGIVVAVAAGNNGWTDGITNPSCASGATTVSSIRKDDLTIDFNRCNLTDILAPGFLIYATNYAGGHTSKSGTSMATPHVAGAAALLNQYYELYDGLNFHAERIEQALKSSGVSKYDSGSGLNFSRIDVLAALDEPIPKGIISENYTATPFYTLNSNPNITSITAGSSELITWTVNSTGDYGVYDFFAFTHLKNDEDDILSNSINISIVDFTHLGLNIESPETNTTFNVSEATFVYNVTDNYDNTLECSLYINNQINATNSSVPKEISANFTENFTDGNYSWYINCSDEYGNCNVSEIRNFIVELIPPSINFTDPTTKTGNYSQNYLEANVTASDLGAGLDQVIIYLYNSTGLIYNYTNSIGFFYNFTGLLDGTYYLNATANDTFGNINWTETRIIILDKTPPSVILNETVSDNNVYLNRNWSYQEAYSDENLNTSKLEWNGTNETAITSGMVCYLNKTNLADGNYTYKFWVNDSVNNWNSTFEYWIYIDTTPPILNIQSPANTTYLTSIIWFNATTDEPVETWIINYNGTNATLLNINTSLTVEDGTYNLLLYGNDSLGNWGLNNSIYFAVDTINPTSNTPIDAQYPQNISATINWTLIDNHGAGYYYVKRNGTIQNQSTQWINNTQINVRVNTSTTGIWNYTIYFNDSVGNSGTDIVFINITEIPDIAPPILNIIIPLNNTIITNSYFNFNFTVKEANPKESFCWFNLTNGTDIIENGTIINNSLIWIGTSGNYTYIFREMGNGNYNLTLNCADLNNQSTQIYRNFTVNDITQPEITNVSTITLGTGTTAVTITLSVTTDEYAVCRYSASDINYSGMAELSITGTTIHSRTFTYNSDSSGTYYVRCNDTAGNVMNTSNSTNYIADITSESGSSNSRRSSSRGAFVISYWISDYTVTDEDFIEGYSKELKEKRRLKIKVDDESHYVGIVELTSTTAKINISSAPQQAIFSVGDEKKFEVTDDSYYDVYVKLNDIINDTANVTIKKIHELIFIEPEEEIEEIKVENKTVEQNKTEPQVICDEGEKRCLREILQRCKDNKWMAIQTCEYGCNSTSLTCSLPKQEKSDNAIYLLIFLVVGLICIAMIWRKF